MKRKKTAIPSSVLQGFKAAQAVSSQLAFKMALKIFLRPMAYPIPKKELEYKRTLPYNRIKINNKQVTLYSNGTAPFKVLLVHGWSGRASQFLTIGKKLAENNIDYLSFTAPAHGSSPDKNSNMLEIAECIKELNRTHGPFDVLIGHSMGGAACINAINQGVKAKKLITIASHSTITGTISDFCKKLELNKKVEQKLNQYLIDEFHALPDSFSIKEIAPSLNIPALVIHDRGDRESEFINAEEIKHAFKNSELLATNGSGHNKILSNSVVVNKIVDFVKD